MSVRFIFLFLCLPLFSIAQNPKKDSVNYPIRIVDASSRNTLNPPLIVINGIKLKPGTGLYPDVDSNDIDSIYVKKSKEAVDMYGEDGKHGALLQDQGINLHKRFWEKKTYKRTECISSKGLY